MIARLLILLVALASAGCGNKGPQQTLHFSAQPLPGANQAEIDLATTKRIVAARIKSAKLRKQFTVETVGLRQLEVAVFGAEPADIEKIKLLVTAAGTLEFAAVAHDQLHDDIVALAKDVEQEVKVDGQVVAEWLPVEQGANGTPKSEFVMQPTVVSRERQRADKTVLEWLIVYNPGERITGDQLQSVEPMLDQIGKPCIGFSLKPEGAANMFATTTELSAIRSTPRKLAIAFNNTVVTAPTVQSALSSRGQITGDFTREDVDRTVAVLRAGRLPCLLTFEKITNEIE